MDLVLTQENLILVDFLHLCCPERTRDHSKASKLWTEFDGRQLMYLDRRKSSPIAGRKRSQFTQEKGSGLWKGR